MRGTVFSLTQTSTCPWKGTASYYDVTVDEQVNKDAAWGSAGGCGPCSAAEPGHPGYDLGRVPVRDGYLEGFHAAMPSVDGYRQHLTFPAIEDAGKRWAEHEAHEQYEQPAADGWRCL